MAKQAWQSHWQDENVARGYDKRMKSLIPHRLQAIDYMIDVLPFDEKRPLKALDIGAGTGAVSIAIIRRFAQCELTMHDGSPAMLEIGLKNVKKRGIQPAFAMSNLTRADWHKKIGDGFDLIASNLCIHHLTSKRKAALMKEIFKMLKPGGVFLYGDAMKMDSPAVQNRLEMQMAEEYVKAHKRKYSMADIKKQMSDHRAHMNKQHDQPDTLAYNMDIVKKAGFKKTDVIIGQRLYFVILAHKAKS